MESYLKFTLRRPRARFDGLMYSSNEMFCTLMESMDRNLYAKRKCIKLMMLEVHTFSKKWGFARGGLLSPMIFNIVVDMLHILINI
jgi:hypothetical protein